MANTLGGLRSASPSWRERLAAWLDSWPVQRAVTGLILFNAVLFGLETSATVMAQVGGLLDTLDRVILAIFVVELGLRLVAFGRTAFRDPWFDFDVVVVGLALVPATGALSALRALRVLRVLRLVSSSPRLRSVVEALLRAIPGLGAIAGLLALILYVAAVIVTNLFGQTHPQWFGTLGASLLTLFQILTLEGWADIQREVLTDHPLAWLFFVPYVLLTTFAMLNLFVAVMVEAMRTGVEGHAEEKVDEMSDRMAFELEELKREIVALRRALTRDGAA
ncbi:MAG: ion transporter [Pseudomonadota bacterium]|nr:ion transporter [Pseudomonadota bacterium]